jgi:hypothetical protein
MESSEYLIKAVFFSLLLHAFVLYLFALFAFKPMIQDVYPSISVTLRQAVTADVYKSEVKESNDSSLSMEEALPSKISPVINEVEEPILEERPLPEVTDSVVSELVSAPQPSAAIESPVENQGVESSLSSPVSANVTDSQPIDKNPLDVEWEGHSARVLSIPDPNFRLPIGGVLPREVLVSFSVLKDGTVGFVQIPPPGTGSISLDQQIRTYVLSFLFESTANDEDRKGVFRLRLTPQESDNP